LEIERAWHEDKWQMTELGNFGIGKLGNSETGRKIVKEGRA
jgi:hypothetical protein